MRVIDFLFRRKRKSKEKLAKTTDSASVNAVSTQSTLLFLT